MLRAFFAGCPLGLIASLWLYRGLHLGAVGYLGGFALGQLVTLAMLLHGIARVIPDKTDETAQAVAGVRGVLAARAVGVRLLRVDLDRQGAGLAARRP